VVIIALITKMKYSLHETSKVISFFYTKKNFFGKTFQGEAGLNYPKKEERETFVGLQTVRAKAVSTK